MNSASTSSNININNNSSNREPARPRPGLNILLTTSVGQFAGGAATPSSAVSAYSSALSPIQRYNPREWVSSPAMGPERFHHLAPEPPAAPMTAAIPPPPYSPPRQQAAGNTTTDTTTTTAQPPMPPNMPVPMSASRASPFSRPSPDPTQNNTSFPPPPTSTSRPASRERRFGFSSLARRRDPETPQHVQPRPAGAVSAFSGRPLTLLIPRHSSPTAQSWLDGSLAAPPSARRTVSAGAIETPTSPRSRSTSRTRWESHHVALPPPPPGPPPSQAGLQQGQGGPGSSGSMPGGQIALTSPGGFANPSSGSQDTDGGGGVDAESSSLGSSAYGLNRSPAIRVEKTIMQRRAESRTVPSASAAEPPHGMMSRQPSNIAIPPRDDAQGGRWAPGNGTAGNERPGQGDANPASQAQHHHYEVPRQPAAAATPTPTTSQTRSASSSQNGVILTPCDSVSSRIARHEVISQTADQFCQDTIERFRGFAMREEAAQSDAERVRLFADFIVTESRIRRERYSVSIGAMGSEILDLTRDLFRPMDAGSRRASLGEGPSSQQPMGPGPGPGPSRSHRGSISSVAREPTSHESSPSIQLVAPISTNVNRGVSNYMPSLSPILSQSISDHHDGNDSRGRPSSRWWETDSARGQQQRQQVERSRRESKYMGLPKEQWIEDEDEKKDLRALGHEADLRPPAWATQARGGGQTEEDTTNANPRRLSQGSAHSSSTLSIPHRETALDISRLVSLPPPFPRHHPAVNNNHPELAETRLAVRAVSNLSEADEMKEKFVAWSKATRQQFERAASDRKQELRQVLQQELNAHAIDYSAAAARERVFERAEHERIKEMEKRDFAEFQAQVVTPVHELLAARISRASGLFDKLAARLFDPIGSTADLPQEEGDDKPELLEKLTLLKWLFDALEMLHKTTFDLLSDRNDRYRHVILTPYRLSGNTEKIKSAESFFANDAAKRSLDFAKDALERSSKFRDVVERTVVKGVEVQLSAFWDIAPSLSHILERIPHNLGRFSIQIPPNEYQENPSYREHPLQYLFSLLLHAEKSTYQFIESQTNLLCLLHQVKEAVAHAKVKVWEQDGSEAGAAAPGADKDRAARELGREEEAHLTADLQDKVREVQSQWHSALGQTIEGVKERVGEWLLQTGGWDEALEDGGVVIGMVCV